MSNSPTYITQSLSNWLSNLKADDIDDGLAADFDGSLSGLGVELGSSTYNMSEALLALPVFKQESVDQGFQYLLNAATSPATKLYEETLTYLNQGQSYEIKVKKLGESGGLKGCQLKSIVRVLFHERRLQYNEREQLDLWKTQRPGERIIDLDVPLCYGVLEMTPNPKRLNSIEFTWDPTKETGIFVKIHAISTEFTPRKHGGEKGAPFRVQVETYRTYISEEKLLHGASCQVRVFKPKGADRKHKTDREKIEKRSEAEKSKCQPSYACTVLTEIPLEQIRAYHEEQQSMLPPTSTPPPSTTRPPETSQPTPIRRPEKRSSKNLQVVTTSSSAAVASSSSASTTPPGVFSTKALVELLEQSSTDCGPRSSRYLQTGREREVRPLNASATAQEVTEWLHINRFASFVKVFQNFAGSDLLRLSRDDLIQICGLADGIRLDNALQSRTVRPRLTLYIYQSRESPIRALAASSSTPPVTCSPKVTSPPVTCSPKVTSAASSPPVCSPRFNNNHSKSSSSTTVTTATIATIATNIAISSSSSQLISTASTDHKRSKSSSAASTETTAKENEQSASKTASAANGDISTAQNRRQSLEMPKIKKELVQSCLGACIKTVSGKEKDSICKGEEAQKSVSSADSVVSSQESVCSSSVDNHTEQPRTASYQGKRQYRDAENEEILTTKKQRTRTLELSRKGVYHAIYMEDLTVSHLRTSLASLLSVASAQLLEIHVQGPSGIHILVTDSVVQNFPDESRFSINAQEDDFILGHYNVLLQSDTT